MEWGFFIILSIIAIIVVVVNIKRKNFSIQESFWWMMGSIAMLILSIFPGIIDGLAGLMHINYPPSLLFIISIIFLLFIVFRNSKRISKQQEKIVELAQQLALVKNAMKQKDRQKNKK